MMHIYCYFNKVGGFYGQPFVNRLSPDEFQKDFVKGLFTLKIDELNSLAEDDLYYVGSFDDDKGIIIPCNDFILHCSDIVNDVKVKRGLEDEQLKN